MTVDPMAAWALSSPASQQTAQQAARDRQGRITAAIRQVLTNMQQAVGLLAARGDEVALARFCLEGSAILARGVEQAELLDRGAR